MRNNLRKLREELRRLRTGRSKSERPEQSESFNIITNQKVDYFDVENYRETRRFKPVNDTIEPFHKRHATADSILAQVGEKYTYSGMGERRFLKYSTKMSEQTRALYFSSALTLTM